MYWQRFVVVLSAIKMTSSIASPSAPGMRRLNLGEARRMHVRQSNDWKRQENAPDPVSFSDK
jgi:hypothetical protein